MDLRLLYYMVVPSRYQQRAPYQAIAATEKTILGVLKDARSLADSFVTPPCSI